MGLLDDSHILILQVVSFLHCSPIHTIHMSLRAMSFKLGGGAIIIHFMIIIS